ncbi:MAG: hypothetical protein ACTSO3_13565 [Candidatus Heimdallarchaeaceae archaeon]
MSRARLNKDGNPFKECDREITVEVMSTISGLSKTGIKVLEYMMSYSPKDADKIYVEKKTVMFECDMKEKSFFNGIKDLVSNNIIAISDISFEYYFNHAYFGKKQETK